MTKSKKHQSPKRQAERLVRLPKDEFVQRCCEMMEIDESSSLTYAGIVDLLENVHEAQEEFGPTIEIDGDALRFSFRDGSGENMFWDRLFCPQLPPGFQVEVMRNIHKAYIECIRANGPKDDPEAT